MKLRMPLFEQKVCEATYPGRIYPGMLCAGYVESGMNVCNHDSGSPLICFTGENISYHCGIVSFGGNPPDYACAQANEPGVYVNTSYYREWIDSKLQLLT